MLQVYNEVPRVKAGAKRFLFVSDNHLGNKSTPTAMMIESLNKTLTNIKVMSEADALFFCGDLFDRLLNLNVEDVSMINSWFISLLHLSVEAKCPIRILEGTPSHDWKQPRILFDLSQYYDIGADIQYVSELSIVHDKTLDLTIGYVPDEWRESHQQTTDEFKELMTTMGLSQVDFIIMHGMFEFQIPKVNIPTFQSSDWSPLVKYAIVIGHDHNHKTYKNIIVPSSHNRLSMNEEADKGYVIIDIFNDEMTRMFIPNPYAKRYDTLELSDCDDDVALEAIKEKLIELKGAESKLRLRLSSESALHEKIAELRKAFGLVTIVIDKVNIQKAIMEIENVFASNVAVINITNENVADMIVREIESKLDENILDGFTDSVKSEISLIMDSL